MPDLFHVALLAGNALILSVTCAVYARTAYHARLARAAASRARADRSDAKRFAEAAERAADRADPPVILPFESVPGGPRDADNRAGA